MAVFFIFCSPAIRPKIRRCVLMLPLNDYASSNTKRGQSPRRSPQTPSPALRQRACSLITFRKTRRSSCLSTKSTEKHKKHLSAHGKLSLIY